MTIVFLLFMVVTLLWTLREGNADASALSVADGVCFCCLAFSVLLKHLERGGRELKRNK